MRARLHVDVETLLFLELELGAHHPVLALEGVELVNYILEAFFMLQFKLWLSEVLLFPKVREFARAVVLAKV
jgi:hypothetical protein